MFLKCVVHHIHLLLLYLLLLLWFFFLFIFFYFRYCFSAISFISRKQKLDVCAVTYTHTHVYYTTIATLITIIWLYRTFMISRRKTKNTQRKVFYFLFIFLDFILSLQSLCTSYVYVSFCDIDVCIILASFCIFNTPIEGIISIIYYLFHLKRTLTQLYPVA